MWRFFSKVRVKKTNERKEKNEGLPDPKKNHVLSIKDFPEKMSKIQKAYPLVKEKETETLTKIINFIKNGKHKEARQLFDELNKIRKDIVILENSKKIIEQTSIQIALLHDMGEALETIEPIINKENKLPPSNKMIEKKTWNSVEKKVEIKNFTQDTLTNILRNDFHEVDFESLEKIDEIYKRIVFKDN